MADDLDARVRDCERHIDRMDGRLARVEDDMRVFRPIPLENAEHRAETKGTIDRLAGDIHEAFEGIRSMRSDFDAYRKEIVAIREAREEKEREKDERDRREREAREKAEAKEKVERAATERRDRWTRVAVILTLSLAFVSLTINTLLQAL